jgi:hypothetical protein
VRVTVHYDPSFARPGTWILNDRGDGVRARFKLGEEPERVVDFEIRRLRPFGGGRVFASPVDGARTTWVTETSCFEIVEGGVRRMQLAFPCVLQLSDCPDWIADTMSQW